MRPDIKRADVKRRKTKKPQGNFLYLLDDEPKIEKQINRRSVSWLKKFAPDVHYEMDLDKMIKLPSAIKEGSQTAIRWRAKVAENNAAEGHISARPDSKVFASRRGYHGLVTEYKRIDSNPITVRGEKRVKKSKNDHLFRQAMILARLYKAGYFACFGVGWIETRKIYEWYFQGKHEPIIEFLTLFDRATYEELELPIISF